MITSKSLFDLILVFIALLFLGWLLILCAAVTSIDTKSFGIFVQLRIGRYGEAFNIFKIKTICSKTGHISKFGRFLRKSKLDELPQLLNVLKGEMSFVGPRPDIPGYYDVLEGEDKKILNLKPGLTSEASLKYFNEEQILKEQRNPLEYNDSILFPDKVQMNLNYYYNHSLYGDIEIICKTLFRYIK